MEVAIPIELNKLN